MAFHISGGSRISTMDILTAIRQPEVPPDSVPNHFFNIAEVVEKLLSFAEYLEKYLF